MKIKQGSLYAIDLATEIKIISNSEPWNQWVWTKRSSSMKGLGILVDENHGK